MKVLKFSASWCQPCKMLQKIIDIAGDKITVDIESLDIDVDTKAAMSYNVRGVPTLILVDDVGNEIKRNVGMLTEERLLEWLK